MLHVDSSNASDSTATAFLKGRIIRFDGAAASHSPRLNFSLDGTDKISVLCNRTDSSLNLITLTSAPIIFETNDVERLRIDTSGRLLHGHTASRTVGTKTGQLQVIESGNNAAISVIQTNNAASAPFLAFGKTRSANDTGSTIVQNGDSLGQILFAGADGSDVDSTGALITAKVDGTPGSNDMPGKLVFATTADGASTATPRMEISSAGIVTCRTIPSFKISIDTDASPNQGVVSENNGFTLNEFRDGFNEGSHFSESTGRFTAPVEGLYFFHFSLMRYSNNGTGSIEMRIKRNGAQILARTYRASYSSNFESHNVSTITRLLAGHYVEFVIGANMSTYNDDSYMLGYLIG